MGSVPRVVRCVRFTAIALLTLAMVLPTAALLAAAAPSSAPSSSAPLVAPSQPEVTWNTIDIATANTASSAFTVTFNEAVNILFTWNLSNRSTSNVNDARLQMLYFGFAFSTRDVSSIGGGNVGPSSAVMNWTVGAIQYVFEGVFGVTASLIAANNGSTVWSENFYVRLVAPFAILAALPLLLIVLGIYEVYMAITTGKYVFAGRKASGPKPPKPETEAPSSGGDPSAASSSTAGAPDSDASPPTEGAP